ncbi:cytochrome b (mitochondrion) [Mizuhopecten yessoensis]|uniref:Cytochrome b n=1 Tax=Mizuhopecten yessoensis TaxID=6573 RepID=A3KCM3_MIZYE|nr:cytochrome b [Mizuhopecten yessoensis]ACL36041.1 cytochrome b [Mizuhopecten yessoensis]BAF47967.1 cytochrome b [Mizuhopecten yessoensis]
MAFMSVSFIMKEVNMGWAFRGFHINVANFMFACLYLHICRGLYYGSFRLYKVWVSGIVLFLLVMLTAFTGYVLPWGQMSYWAAQVISSMVTAIPVVGGDVAMWVWGGYAVGNITLKRLFSVHFLLPFIILAVFFLHLNFLHESGSGNPLGVDTDCCLVRFHSFFTVKDMVGVMGGCALLCFMIAFYPYMLVDGQNFVMCDYMDTPKSIHPEWYFLFAYAILRSIPNKIGGILLMLSSIMILFVIPELWVGKMESLGNYVFCQWLFWFWVANFLILTFVGSQGVDEPFARAGELSTAFYFAFFPLLGVVQRYEDFVIRSISKVSNGEKYDWMDSVLGWKEEELDDEEDFGPTRGGFGDKLMSMEEANNLMMLEPYCWGGERRFLKEN